MARSKPVVLGRLQFSKQADALQYFKDLLGRTPTGTELKGQDFEDVEALLSGHPRATDKIGIGISKLIVDSDETGSKCFHVVRSDGSKDNFSYKKCISGDPAPFTNFSIACRRAVTADLDTFKAK